MNKLRKQFIRAYLASKRYNEWCQLKTDYKWLVAVYDGKI